VRWRIVGWQNSVRDSDGASNVELIVLEGRPTFPSTAEGRRQLIAWVRRHKVTKVVMEASGGYERTRPSLRDGVAAGSYSPWCAGLFGHPRQRNA
jgi:hypothetical protein